jgi:hypothetical protein
MSQTDQRAEWHAVAKKFPALRGIASITTSMAATLEKTMQPRFIEWKSLSAAH